MKRTMWLFAAALSLLLPARAEAQETQAELVLPLNDANVVNEGARMRLTKGTWDYLKITVRDTMKTWSAPGGAGINTLLDPGYNYSDPGDAGFVRTTPLSYDYVRYDVVWTSTHYRNCNSCGGEADTITCTPDCNKTQAVAPSPLWMQVRKPGFSWNDFPTVPSDVRLAYRDYGFYVADKANPFEDFYQLQFCTERYYFDRGGRDSPSNLAAKRCTAARTQLLNECAVWICVSAYLQYNIRLYIFPNMRQEYAADPVNGWAPPTLRGPFSGMSGLGATTVRWINGCGNGSTCTDVGNCTSCAAWICWKSGDRWTVSCNAGTWNMPVNIWRRALPTTVAGHNPNNAWDRITGTYFRAGDDTALYFNIYQMQIHSVDRASFNGSRDCEGEKFYTGRLVSGQPEILQDTDRIANCMRPKMWFNITTNRWTQCDPYDTWNADGTLNENRDDAKWMYPGHPDTGGFSSPGRCGAQPPCTDYTCTSRTDGYGSTWAWPDGKKAITNNPSWRNYLFTPGGGWYMFQLDYLNLYSGADPRMELRLSGKDIRLEIAAVADARVEGTVTAEDNNMRAVGRARIKSMVIDATLRLYSVDDTSCNPAQAATCSGFWKSVDDQKLNPDHIAFDIAVGNITVTPDDPFYSGECDAFEVDLLITTWRTTLCEILNDEIDIFGITIPVGTTTMIVDIIEDALKDLVGPALSDFTAAIPNLNQILGDPITLGTAMIETGIFAVGGSYTVQNMPDGTKRYPIPMLPYSAANREITDMRMSIGFKPVAFRPPGANNVMDIDLNDPPLPDSVYGVPTLMNPDTTPCGTNCSLGAHASTEDEDQMYDNDDYVTAAGGGYYANPKGGANLLLSQYKRVPEYWKGPLDPLKSPPSWCMQLNGNNAPRTLRTSADDDLFKTIYPRTRWLSFDNTYDNPPAGSGLVDAGRNTVGDWDQMPANSVLRQDFNDGSMDPSAIQYDLSIHIHQRTLAQFLQAMVASGIGCIEISGDSTDVIGKALGSILSTEAFASFIPELAVLYPGGTAKVRISPVASPRIRTGMGTMSYTPNIQAYKNGVRDASEDPRPMSGSYMLSVAVPDVRFEMLVTDPETGEDVSIMTLYWTPLIGLAMQHVRRCYYLDPLMIANDPKCTSQLVNVRTVSGYYEFYIDVNHPNLTSAWENGSDFPAGYWSDKTIGNTRGSSSVVIEKTFCDTPEGQNRCDMIGLSQFFPTLLSSVIQVFAVARFSFQNLTFDFLYVGPDGPNDDGKGGGDFVGIYTRFLGNLNVFGLLESAALFAPQNGFEPLAYVPDLESQRLFATNTPSFDVKTVRAMTDRKTEVSYTYAVDGGTWHSPVADDILQLATLTEGEHTLALRAVEHAQDGNYAALEPTLINFRIDTVPPLVNILPSPQGTYNRAVQVEIRDFQTPFEELKAEYSWDGTNWEPLEGPSVSVRGFENGRHTLRVRATDAVGLTNTASRVIVVEEASSWWWNWGCNVGGNEPDAGLIVLVLTLLGLGWRARRRGQM